MHGRLNVSSNLRATLVSLETGERREWAFHNTVTSGGLSLLRDYLWASDPTLAPGPPLYFAVGSGTGIDASRFMQIVPGEFFRTGIAQRDPVGHGVTFHVYLDGADASSPVDGGRITDFVRAVGNGGSITDLVGAAGGGPPRGMTIGAYGLYAGTATNMQGTRTNPNGTLIAVAAEPDPFNKNLTNTLSLDWTFTISGSL